MYAFLGFQNYDIPLHQNAKTDFLTVLIILMSFLSVLAMNGTLSLNAMAKRWSSGLENKITIEIPAETANGNLLSNDTIKKETLKVAKAINDIEVIKNSSVMSTEEIQELISPWIGKNLHLHDIPLPGLIAIELHTSAPSDIETLKKEVSAVSEYAHIETHREWLTDLIQFTKTLRLISFLIFATIISITVTAIISGIMTRMLIHKKEIEILHSIGASDTYIARQFQRHAMITSLRGSIIGTAGALLCAAAFQMAIKESQTPFTPSVETSGAGIALICIIPIAVTLISSFTAHITVLRSLSKIP